jgi:hypothetical protein
MWLPTCISSIVERTRLAMDAATHFEVIDQLSVIVATILDTHFVGHAVDHVQDKELSLDDVDPRTRSLMTSRDVGTSLRKICALNGLLAPHGALGDLDFRHNRRRLVETAQFRRFLAPELFSRMTAADVMRTLCVVSDIALINLACL